MRSYTTGDYVRIITQDGETFEGILTFDDLLVYLNGYGFPHEMVAVMELANT